MPVEMTRAKLDGYRKLVQEIPILECELRELWLTDKGMGNSVIINGKNGSKKPESVVGFDHAALIFLYRCLTELLKNDDSTLFMVMPSSSFLYMPSSAEYRKSLVYFWNIERIYDFTPLINHLWGKKKVATIAVKISNKYFNSSKPIEHIR